MADLVRPILQFQLATEIKVSAEARQLLELLLDGIVWDPHPDWKESRSALLTISSQLAESLPAFLNEVVALEKVTETITLYHVVHALSRRLERWCPIQK